jgi:hypothetical protein
MDPLLATIQAYLRRTGMRPTRFSRDATRDPRFVHDLGNGRRVGAKLAARVLAYIAERP